MKKKDVELLLRKAYKAGQESITCIKLVNKGKARFDQKNNEEENMITNLLKK